MFSFVYAKMVIFCLRRLVKHTDNDIDDQVLAFIESLLRSDITGREDEEGKDSGIVFPFGEDKKEEKKEEEVK